MSETNNKTDLEEITARIRSLLEGDFSPVGETSLKEEENQLLQVLDTLRIALAELDTYTQELAKGNLSVQPPSRENYLAGGVKALHAQLNHLVWQAKQVSQGNYYQVLDYMGEISDAFNEMTDQIKIRQKKFTQNQESMMRVFNNLDVLVMVCEEKSGKMLFINHAAEELFFQKKADMPNQETSLYYAVLGSLSDYYSQNDIYDKQTDKWYRVESNRMEWNSGENAILITCMDITAMKRTAEELSRAAKVDGMTGIFNRTAGLRLLKEIINKDQEKTLFTLCYIDMDNLKYINDNYGHRTGDESIITLSDILSSLLRANDLFIRMGGDEFVVVFMGLTLAQSQVVIKRICQKFEAWNQNSGKPYRLEFTYGLYEMRGNEGDLESILDKADQRMYRAKRQKKEMEK